MKFRDRLLPAYHLAGTRTSIINIHFDVLWPPRINNKRETSFIYNARSRGQVGGSLTGAMRQELLIMTNDKGARNHPPPPSREN